MGLGIFKKLFMREREVCSLLNKEKFDGAINMAKKVMENDPIDIFDIIRVHGKKIQYEYLSEFLKQGGIEKYYDDRVIQLSCLDEESLWISSFDDSFSKNYSNWFMNEIRGKEIEGSNIVADLNFDVVLPWPWRGSRLVNCFANIGEGKKWGPWRYDETNHDLNYMQEIGLFYVYGGNHSIATGVMRNEGKVPAKYQTSMQHMYESIVCDGANYYKKEGPDLVKLCGIRNIDFAIIYELGRMALECGVDYQEYKKSRLR